MDPNAAWKELTQAFMESSPDQGRNYDRCSVIAIGLLEWLAKGGFPPTISGNPDFDKFVAVRTCRSLAYHRWIYGK